MAVTHSLYGVPAILLLAWVCSCLTRQPCALWRIGRLASSAALLWALWCNPWVCSSQAPGLVMLLFSLLAWVILTFSADYLTGEARQPRYVRAMLLTLTAVSGVIASDDLRVMAACWIVSSLGLHSLLLFYPERAAAQLAAHKKFIVSRLADLCLLAALTLIYWQSGRWDLPGIFAWQRGSGLNNTMQWALVLLVLAVILKSAQLPVHGWLLQVMEAPTPVSALLHAGIVNLGGYWLIRLAPLLAEAWSARTLLVLFGSVTALVASLVMLTRISIKLRLAWSTCAQMGFMLVECGLGWYELALLHLLAHSLYKAWSFLDSGNRVLRWREQQCYAAGGQRPVVAQPVLALLCSALVTAGLCWLAARYLPALTLSWAQGAIWVLALATCWWQAHDLASYLLASLRAAELFLLYLLWHGLLSGFTAVAAESIGLESWTLACLAGLYLMQSYVQLKPDSRWLAQLYPWFYGGLFLDERFTRLTFRLWPMPPSARWPAKE